MDFDILLSIWKLLSSWRTKSSVLVPGKEGRLRRFTALWTSLLMFVVFCKQLSCGISAYDDAAGSFSDSCPEIMTTRDHKFPSEINIPRRYLAIISTPPPLPPQLRVGTLPSSSATFRVFTKVAKIIITTTTPTTPTPTPTTPTPTAHICSLQRGSQTLSHWRNAEVEAQGHQPVVGAAGNRAGPTVSTLYFCVG